MDDFKKRERLNKLLAIYGNALSKIQMENLTAYYSDDLSLAEIASNRSVSRNAVHLSIKKGEKDLEKMESELHILEKSESLLKEIEDLAKEKDEKAFKEKIETIKGELTHGI
jgi:predicted DNA-binding protein YlxM (UPF0122 family)